MKNGKILDINEIDNISTPIIKYYGDKICAPNRQFVNGSCLLLDELIKIVTAFNKDPDNNEKIKVSETLESISPKKYKKYLLASLMEKTNVTSQKELLSQMFTKYMNPQDKEKILENTWQQDGPSGQFTWLSNFDIEGLMNNMEKEYNDFKFFGAVPIDYDKINTELRYIDFDALLNEKINKIGVVFNTDVHTGPGEHWIAVFCFIDKSEIYFFDSYGTRPIDGVLRLIQKFVKYCRSKNKSPKVRYNHVRHQYKGSECGVYSVNFIIRMLRGDKFETICKDKTPDDTINKCRVKYFHGASKHIKIDKIPTIC